MLQHVSVLHFKIMQYYSTVWLYHVLFIRSSVGGHVSTLWLLWPTLYGHSWANFYADINSQYPWVDPQEQNCWATRPLCSASGGTADCFPKRLCRFTFPLAVRGVPVSPHLSQHLLLYVFDYSHPSGYEVTSHCGYKVSFEEQKFLIWKKIQFVDFFSFRGLSFLYCILKIIGKPVLFSPCPLPRPPNSVVLSLKCMSMVHFELTMYKMWGKAIQFSQQPILKNYSFTTELSWHPDKK